MYYHGHNKNFIIIITYLIYQISSKFDNCRLFGVLCNEFVLRFICLKCS